MTIPPAPWRDISLLDRLVGFLSLPGSRLQALGRTCAHPGCRRRSVQYSFSRRLEGVDLAGRWLCGPACYEAEMLRMFNALIVSRRRQPAPRKARIPLGLMLLSRGELTQAQLREVLEEHRAKGTRVGDILLQKGYASEEQLTYALAAQWGHPTFPSNTGITWLPVRVPIFLAERYRVIPLHYIEASRTLLMGFADGPDHRILPEIQRMLGCQVGPCFITMSEYQRRLHSLKGEDRANELLFDRACSPAEIARVSASYIRQLGAPRADFSMCGQYLWVRLHARLQVDLLFRCGA
ncbi:MAG TPA: hypothetical protein VLT90_01340 [Terriglobales bacterium]|nr:hypothetical protein [Terriglobales bacterium]